MAKSVMTKMPNLLAKNKKASLGVLLLLLAGGMIFFAGNHLNQLIINWFQNQGIDGMGSFIGMIVIALTIATGGYYIMKKT